MLTGIEPADKCTVTGADGALLSRAASEILPANVSDDAPADHSALVHLNEPAILHNTRMRFATDQIYTFTGRILVAVNPFKRVDGLYGTAATERYAKQAWPTCQPCCQPACLLACLQPPCSRPAAALQAGTQPPCKPLCTFRPLLPCCAPAVPPLCARCAPPRFRPSLPHPRSCLHPRPAGSQQVWTAPLRRG